MCFISMYSVLNTFWWHSCIRLALRKGEEVEGEGGGVGGKMYNCSHKMIIAMHNTGVKPQLRQCYQKVILMKFVCSVLSTLNYTQLYYFVYNIVDKLLIFSNLFFQKCKPFQEGDRGRGAAAGVWRR